MENVRRMRDLSSPVIMDDGTVNLQAINFSAVDMYQRCGKQYWFRYVKGRRSPPSIALAEGSSHHKAVEEDNLEKMSHDRELTSKKLTELFVHEFRNLVPVYQRECDELKTDLDWGGEDEDAVVRRAKILHDHYSSKFSPHLRPVMVEEAVSKEYEVGGVKFRLFGQLDMATRDTVWDYKAVKRAKTERDARESVQLGVYAKMVGKAKTGFISFVKQKPHVEVVRVERTPAGTAGGLGVVASVVDSIRRGSFPLAKPDPMSWWCSQKFCGDWDDCRGKK